MDRLKLNQLPQYSLHTVLWSEFSISFDLFMDYNEVNDFDLGGSRNQVKSLMFEDTDQTKTGSLKWPVDPS